MKYLIIGAGGTGGPIGGFLTRAGLDVTLIARGAHLTAMKERGLAFHTMEGDFTVPVRACTEAEYTGTPDVVFVCVKGYSLKDTLPFLRRICGPDTVVIPVLNLYGTGGALQAQLPETTVTDGCIYIMAEIEGSGTIRMNGTIFRVVFGLRRGTAEETVRRVRPVLEGVRRDLEAAGIKGILSDRIETDAFEKFSFVSPMAAIGTYYGVSAAAMQREGPERAAYQGLVEELIALGQAMGAPLPADIMQRNLAILDGVDPASRASMQRDVESGHASEADGLIAEVTRLGRRYHVPTPGYDRIAAALCPEEIR